MQIPTPAPTVVEQQRGPEVNCSCTSGEKVKPPEYTILYPYLLFPWLSGNSFFNGLPKMPLYFISHREILEHPVLLDPRVKRSSTTTLQCGKEIQVCFVSELLVLHFDSSNIFRGKLALKARSDRVESEEKKEKLYECTYLCPK